MSTPKDPWGPRPDDAPTEHLGHQAQNPAFGNSGHTDDPTVAYGGHPAPPQPTQQFEPWTPPPVNATRQMPAHENQWGAYESGAYDAPYGAQWSGAPGQPPPGAAPPGGAPPGYGPQPQPPRKRNTGLWIALALGVIALVAVVGVGAGVLLGDKGSDQASGGAASTTRSFPTAQIPTAPSTSGSRSPSGLPGLPGLDNLGATMGTISANNGGTLTLSTLSGESVTVRTDDKTQVISLSGAKPSDLKVGDVVMVQGDKSGDGSIKAELIISTSLPGGPR